MKRQSADYYIDGILDRNVVILSQSITLVESKLFSDNELAGRIVDGILKNTGDSIRIGVTGVPGVGKSTFIESFGMHLVNNNKRVAVLAIDPSSKLTGGSILGDKTRMDALGRNENAFIRPSPTGNTLGGVADKTRESILLCEAAGYDVILVETVGVGQSEVIVDSMVDFFLLLMLAGAGDELQGIKKGIMEMVDGLVINKADGANIAASTKAKSDYKKALHLFPPTQSGWIPKVLTCSAMEKTGLNEVWEMISQYQNDMLSSGFLAKNRVTQNIEWFRQQLSSGIMTQIFSDKETLQLQGKLESEILNGLRDSKSAINILKEHIFSAIRNSS